MVGVRGASDGIRFSFQLYCNCYDIIIWSSYAAQNVQLTTIANTNMLLPSTLCDTWKRDNATDEREFKTFHWNHKTYRYRTGDNVYQILSFSSLHYPCTQLSTASRYLNEILCGRNQTIPRNRNNPTWTEEWWWNSKWINKSITVSKILSKMKKKSDGLNDERNGGAKRILPKNSPVARWTIQKIVQNRSNYFRYSNLFLVCRLATVHQSCLFHVILSIKCSTNRATHCTDGICLCCWLCTI